MAAITDYATLQAAIADYMARADLTAQTPDYFITLAEARLNRELRVRQMETRATLTPTAGDPYVALPADFLELRNLVAQTTPRRVLTYLTPQQIEDTYADGSSGFPANYSVVGTDLRIGPTPADATDLEITYYAKVPALSGSNTTNWLVTSAPDLYLYAALLEATPFIQDDDRIQVWMGFYDRAIAAVKGEDGRARWTGAPLQTRIDVRAW